MSQLVLSEMVVAPSTPSTGGMFYKNSAGVETRLDLTFSPTVPAIINLERAVRRSRQYAAQFLI